MGIRLRKMKATFITILALCFVGYTYTAQGTPAKTSHCMGNVDDATTCSSCFNWGSGDIGAKQLATNACASAVSNAITDCKYYNGVITSTMSLQDCAVCDSKTWLNLTDHGTAASRLRTCSDTAVNTTTCTAVPSNCDQGLCYVNAAGAATVGCRMCSSGYKGGATAVSSNDGTVGYTTCVSQTVTNCDLGSATNNANCYTCNSNYAVATAQTSCVAFTVDSNCRQLGTGDTYCGQCWHAYYFETTTCILAAKMFAFSGLVIAFLAFLN